jgi:anthranilate/para-aminobenzoate synthase component II
LKTPLKPKIVLVDHDDSFTQNLKWWLLPSFSVELVDYQQLNGFAPTSEIKLVVLSAGPKSPSDYKLTLNWLKKNSSIPTLGICLGFQIMTLAENGRVEKYSPVQHGKSCSLKFTDVSRIGFSVARYHSLECLCSTDFNVIAQSEFDHKIMWAEHKSKPWIGWQFHPESFLTDDRDFLMAYLLTWINKQ